MFDPSGYSVPPFARIVMPCRSPVNDRQARILASFRLRSSAARQNSRNIDDSADRRFNCAMPHVYYALDLTVAVYVVNFDRVLLVHHKSLDMWLPVGGHIDPGETPEDAVLREAIEEVGLHVYLVGNRPDLQFDSARSLCAPTYMDVHPIDHIHSHVGMIYFATCVDSDVILQESELLEARWFSESDLVSLTANDSVLYYARQALRQLGSRTSLDDMGDN